MNDNTTPPQPPLPQPISGDLSEASGGEPARYPRGSYPPYPVCVPVAAPAATLSTGSIVATRYRLSAFLALGRRAELWEAVALDQQPERTVVVKVATGGDARFDRAGIDLCKPGPPNLVEIVEDGHLVDGRPFVVLEYVDGISLRQLMAACGAVNWITVRSILLQLGRALTTSHACGLVHGAITPEHILLCDVDRVAYPEGQVKLLGLGSSLGAGSPDYMAPEQLTRTRIDARTDVFALGAIVVEMLSGRGPFCSTTLSVDGALARRRGGALPKIELSIDHDQLRPALVRALADDPADRFATVDEFVEALTGERSSPLARGSEPIICHPRSAPTPRWRRWFAGAISTLMGRTTARSVT